MNTVNKLLFVSVLALLLAPAFATTSVFPVPDDAFVYNQYPDTPYGSNDLLGVYADNDTDTYERTYLKVNLSTLPANAVVSNAVLSVAVSGSYGSPTGNINVTVHDLYSDEWNQSLITWNNQPCGNVVDVLNLGCNSTYVTKLMITEPSQFVNFSITDMVIRHLGLDEFSLLLKPEFEDAPENYVYFNSSELENGMSPYVTLTYTVPAPVTTSTVTVCFYTYADYIPYLVNNSWTFPTTQPDAVRPKALLTDNDTAVWIVKGSSYSCGYLSSGCRALTVNETGIYNVWVADNTDFTADCVPVTSKPRFKEQAGDISITVGENSTLNYFVDFEAKKAAGSSLMSMFPKIMALMIGAGVLFLVYVVSLKAGAAVGLMIGVGSAIILYWLSSFIMGVFT